LARDHSGIKPLYYATSGGNLVFGSEVKALFASGLLSPELDVEAVPEYFATGHVSDHRTLLRGVRKLPPGHWLRWRRGSLEVARFWSLRDAAREEPGSRVPGSREEAAKEFWDRFVAAVRSQLMSDVPLGAFLSGGLDSSLIVAAMTELKVPVIETFAVGYPDREANELPFARVVASRYRTRHHEVSVSPEEFFTALPRLTWHRDFPLSFDASIPLAAVAESARAHVKVVLTGEGSDELFAGYGRYRRALINMRWGERLDRWLPRGLRSTLSAATDHLGDGYLGSRIRRSFLGQPGNAVGAFVEPVSEFGRLDRGRLLENQAEPFGPIVALLDSELLRRNPLEAFLRLDQDTYLEELLMKQDTMSMAASIESRVPFLDHTLRVWAARLPPEYKLEGWTGKAVVRAAGVSHLPEEVIYAKKRGFPVPLSRWFREPTGLDMIESYVLQDMSAAGLRNGFPRILMSQHQRGQDHSRKLWRLLAFGVWLRDTVPRLAEAARRAAAHSLA
jgi:asparagine synthase (glutamine-hydrolysing)